MTPIWQLRNALQCLGYSISLIWEEALMSCQAERQMKRSHVTIVRQPRDFAIVGRQWKVSLQKMEQSIDGGDLK